MTAFLFLHRFTLRCLCFLVAAIVPPFLSAGEFDGNPCYLELSGTEELCGWVELGTHDSVELPTPVTEIPVLPAPTVESSVSALTTAAAASVGVRIEQIIEPFAMVGPYLENSRDSVAKLQDWWKVAVAEAEALRDAETPTDVDSRSVEERVDALAALEPIDVENLGPSVLVEPIVKQEREPTIEITNIDTLVGSSPVIATLEEAYLPYDLAASDIKLWSVFPITTRPFCIRSRGERMHAETMWKAAEASAEENQVAASTPAEPYQFCGSADCHLDELIWKLDNLIADDSQLWATLSPRNLGRQLAAVASGGNALVRDATGLLAAHWPAVSEDEVEPSAAGAALLARAGAIEAETVAAGPVAATEARVAEAESGTSLR